MGNKFDSVNSGRNIFCHTVTVTPSFINLSALRPKKFQSKLRLRTADEIKSSRVSAYQYLVP